MYIQVGAYQLLAVNQELGNHTLPVMSCNLPTPYLGIIMASVIVGVMCDN